MAAPPPFTPSGPIRRITAEQSDTLALIGSLSAHLKQVSEELATERKFREDEGKKGVSVLRLHVPFVMVFAIVGGLLGISVTATVFFYNTRAHIADKQIHADAAQVEVKGGIAYQKDVDGKVADAISGIEKDNRQALRVLVKASPLLCFGNGKVRECKFSEPVSPR